MSNYVYAFLCILLSIILVAAAKSGAATDNKAVYIIAALFSVMNRVK